MSHHSTVLGQLLELLPRHEFESLVRSRGGDRYVKRLTTWRQLTTLLYAQIKGYDSLREITASLNAQRSKSYHLGLEPVTRSTLADANKRRDPAVFEGLFHALLKRCQETTPRHAFRFRNPLFSMDATTIDLCLSLFPWAKFRQTKGALKLHCLLDHRGCIPSFVVATEGNRHEAPVAKATDWPLLPDSIVTMDRGYVDFKWLQTLHSRGVFFVIRAKKNMVYEVTGQHPLPHRKGLVADFRIRLTGTKSRQDYPGELRLVRWYDEEHDRELEFLTNNVTLAAATVAAIYKARWQIELFFKWIKQNLKIKAFLGTSRNAVLTQIWVAMCSFLLLAYIKFQTRYRHPMLALARIFRETLMDRIPLTALLSLHPDRAIRHARDPAPQFLLL